ncbi:hypothetical protein BDR07DRAFT_1380685 [Suillus spraguei]|nr:hypothetical protein BDR07DRAFT_1380685 [Suillus spraguei]
MEDNSDINEGEDETPEVVAKLLSDEVPFAPNTQRVVKGAIVEVKCHLLFIDGFPELVDKNQLSHQSLLIVAAQRNLREIEKHLRMDDNYISHLASLVDACIPILWRELKDDACAKVSGYFCLGHIDIEKPYGAACIYLCDEIRHKFIAHNVPSPIWNKPYQGELLIALIFSRIFNGSQSIGVHFAEHFADLMENNTKRPEVPIPLVALMATVVYAALVWKHLKYAGGAEHTAEQNAALKLLNLDGMDDG